MYPHERSLVENYKNRPFAILGVNSDPVEDVKKIKEDENITWRSWLNGSTSGPISTAWRVTGWPTIYLIDHNGIIREKNVRGPKLDEVIESLVAEAEAQVEKT